jgi:hypothetical protein
MKQNKRNFSKNHNFLLKIALFSTIYETLCFIKENKL